MNVARPRWRNPFFAALAILTVVVGLLTMQTLSVGSDFGHSASLSLTSAAPGTSAFAPDPATSKSSGALESCVGGFCDADCLMLGMICMLGLLTAVVTWILRRGTLLSAATLSSARVAKLVAQLMVIVAPPSLYLLSINRT